jgi:NAD(P)-dependent dehydrogenase (short-subunit alcohol dehydrogenase family)
MDLGIAGLRVLVTAGASGIGREIALAFREEGARVHICDIDAAALDVFAAEAPDISRTLCDVADRQSVAATFETAITHLGGLDCLVNNAGIAGPTGRVDEIAPDDWDRTLAVNITGQYNCVRLAIAHLAQSRNPTIINLSSVAGRFGFAQRTPYAATKWAVIGFTKSLSIELGPMGIRVNTILPGVVAGERQERVLAAKALSRNISVDEMRELAIGQASIKEMVTPRQLADMALFLSSLRAKTFSGQAVSICGDLQALT